MPEIADAPVEVNYPTRVHPAVLVDHYKETPLFVHWWSRAGQAGVLWRINCATCGACWLELRVDGKRSTPPAQVIFLNLDGDQVVAPWPLDAVTLLGAA